MTDPRDSLVGRIFDGRYRLDELIGRGGMGEVYRCRHLMMEHDVAIKVLRADLGQDAMAVRRFAREAKSTFRLDHPNCVRVLDFGVAEGDLLYLVMEYLDGRMVYDEINVDGAMAAARVVHIARQVADALSCAHDMGFIHRDLKPENIMLLQRGGDADYVKVLDFGLAKLMTGPGGIRTRAFSASPLTRQGMIFGTPEYMSPEQASDLELTPSTDLYSLGVVMYEMLTAGLPFAGETFVAVLAKHIQEPPVPPGATRPDLVIPRELDALIMRCLAKQPAARPASARSLSAELAALEARLPPEPARLPRQISASSTVDLDAHAIQRAADSQASAETVALAPSPPPSPSLRSPPSSPLNSGDAPSSAGVSMPSSPARSRFSLEKHQDTYEVPRGGRRGVILLGAGISAAVIIGILVALVGSGGSRAGQSVAAPGNPASLVGGAAASDASAVTAPPRPAPIAVAATPGQDPGKPASHTGAGSEDGLDGSSGAGETGRTGEAGSAATSADADQTLRKEGTPERPDGDRPAAPGNDQTDEKARAEAQEKRLRSHLERAERARRDGNLLDQMAEAQAAWRIESSNLSARYLFGDALVRSGDAKNMVRGCKLLHQARRLPAAQKARSQAGCPD